jgi:hypothetical protein
MESPKKNCNFLGHIKGLSFPLSNFHFKFTHAKSTAKPGSAAQKAMTFVRSIPAKDDEAARTTPLSLTCHLVYKFPSGEVGNAFSSFLGEFPGACRSRFSRHVRSGGQH